jgi:hypothetical protein
MSSQAAVLPRALLISVGFVRTARHESDHDDEARKRRMVHCGVSSPCPDYATCLNDRSPTLRAPITILISLR